MRIRPLAGFAGLVWLAGLLVAGCGGGGSSNSSSSGGTELQFDPSRFPQEAMIDHTHLPLLPGVGARYEAVPRGSGEMVRTFVSHQTRNVAGVDCVIVVERNYRDGQLVEESFDTYAQDDLGNVWCLGESSTRFESGRPVGSRDEWEAGIDGAEPEVVLGAHPKVGDLYGVGSPSGDLEARTEVVGVDIPVVLFDGQTHSTIIVRESARDDDQEDDSEGSGRVEKELKYYARGMGLVLEESLTGGDRRELRSVTLDSRPEVRPEDFVLRVDNPLFPLVPGSEGFFSSATPEGAETIEMKVLSGYREILGVRCTIVEERVYHDGSLVEETLDWYAQDKGGNVWYFGEDSREYENGAEVSRGESWEAGRNGAYPGIIMRARPRAGDTYRQENAPGVADELSAVLEVSAEVHVALGRFENCLKTLEWSPLDEVIQLKYYAPGIGAILEIPMMDDSLRVELVDWKP